MKEYVILLKIFTLALITCFIILTYTCILESIGIFYVLLFQRFSQFIIADLFVLRTFMFIPLQSHLNFIVQLCVSVILTPI